MIAALEVELVRFALLRRALRQKFLLDRRQLQPELVRDLGCDLFLHVENVGELRAKPIAPDLRPVARADQLDIDEDVCAEPLHASPERVLVYPVA